MRWYVVCVWACVAIAAGDIAYAQSTDLNRILDLGAKILGQGKDRNAPQTQPQEDLQRPEPSGQGSAPSPDAAPAPHYTREQVAETQQILTELGYDPGPVDGLMGRRTRRAIRDFEDARGLPVTGIPSDTLLGELRRARTDLTETPGASAPPPVASFDCGRASTPSEVAICASEELATLDREVAAAYGTRLDQSSADERTQVKRDQRLWIGRRDNCGADQACLAGEMRERIAALGAPRIAAASGQGPGDAAPPGRDLAYIALRNAAQVAVVDLARGEIVKRIPVGPLPRATTASADGNVVAAVNDGDLTVSLIGTKTNTVIETLDYRSLMSRAQAQQRDRTQDQTSAGEDGEAHGAGHGAGDHAGELEMGNVVLGPAGERIYIAASYFGVMSVDRASGAVRLLGDGHGNDQMIGPTNGVLKLSRDGSKLFMPDFGHQGLSIIDTDRMALLGSVPGLTMTAFDVSEDGKFVAAFDREIEVGDLETFEVRQLTHDRWRHSMLGGSLDTMLDPVEISPDGKRLYALRRVERSSVGAIPDDYEIVAFDLASGAVLGSVAVGEKPTSGMALSPDGRRIAIASPATNTLHVYDALSLAETRAIQVAPTPTAYIDFIITPPGPEAPAGAEQVAVAGVGPDHAAKAAPASEDLSPQNDSPALVAEAQRLLNQLGYEAGPVDGSFDRATRRAILEFELDDNRDPSGDVSHALIARLRAVAGAAPPATPAAADVAHGAGSSGAAADLTGVYCFDRGTGPNVLALRAAGDDLDLGISSWQGGMHHCGVLGRAHRTPDGWALVEDGCTVRLRREDDSLRIAAEPPDACQSFCGARARLDGLDWRMSDRTDRTAGALLDRGSETLFNAGCD